VAALERDRLERKQESKEAAAFLKKATQKTFVRLGLWL
jgi:hypothetical protein